LPVIERLCKDKGWLFSRDTKTFKQHGTNGECDHMIKVPGAEYEIGVINAGIEDQWDIKADLWSMGGLDTHLGHSGMKFVANYGQAKVEMTAEACGKSWEMVDTGQPHLKKLTINMAGDYSGADWDKGNKW